MPACMDNEYSEVSYACGKHACVDNKVSLTYIEIYLKAKDYNNYIDRTLICELS